MYEVGQKLWFVAADFTQSHEVTVVKVARVWATLDIRLRCDADGLVDGGDFDSPGRCYPDRETYEQEQARLSAWHMFQCALERKKMPSHLTLDELAQISATLGMAPFKGTTK